MDTQTQPSLISTLNGCEWSIYCRHKSTLQSQWPEQTWHWSTTNYVPLSFIKFGTGMTQSLKWQSCRLDNQEIIIQFPPIFSFCKVSRPTLEPTQLTSQHAQMASSKAVKWLGNEADLSLLYMAMKLIIFIAMAQSPTCLHNGHWVNFTFTLSASLKYKTCILITVQQDATQIIYYYSASSLYMFRVSTTPIIRSTQNCNYSLRYWSYFLCSSGGCSYSFVYSWWWVWLTPKTCRVNLQNNK